MPPALTPTQIRHYEEHGFVVLRGRFTDDEIDRAAKSALRCVRGEHAVTEGEPYPAPATLYALIRHHVEEPDLADFEQDDGLCRAYAHPLEEDPHLQPVMGTETGWFTAEEIRSLQSAGKLAGGYEPQAIDLWLDDAYLRGIGQSKSRAAPGRA